jgi:hypothetical protein
MQRNGTLDLVKFGPTTIQLMPTSILDKYIQLRYGKRSPCQFPYDSGELEENYLGNSSANYLVVPKNDLELYTSTSRRRFNIDFATSKWYIPQRQRETWRAQAGNGKQKELTQEIPNLDQLEIDNTIAEPGACNWDKGGATTLKVIGFNAERGKYWDIFGDLVKKLEDLNDPDVILMNEMDIGMVSLNRKTHIGSKS